MSETPVVERSREKIRTALKRWKSDLTQTTEPIFHEFVHAAVERLRGPFLAQHSPRKILQYLQKTFLFFYERKPDDVKVVFESGLRKGLIVMSSMPDQPFIVDTIRLMLKNHNADYSGGFNLIFNTERDASGRLTGAGSGCTQPESLVLIEADRGTLPKNLDEVARKLHVNLRLAQAMVADFRAMLDEVGRCANHFEALAEQASDNKVDLQETAELCQWLLRENFVFMGIEGRQSLGIQRIRSPLQLSDGTQWPKGPDHLYVQVRKSSHESPIHRAGRIDEIRIRLPAADGQKSEKILIRGMFTYRAVTQLTRFVPILKNVLTRILSRPNIKPGSFRYKGIGNVFDSLPTEFLFTATQEAIEEILELVLDGEQRNEPSFILHQNTKQSSFCLVTMPKVAYNDDLRKDIQSDIQSTLKASYVDHGLLIGRFDTVMLHFFLTGVSVPSKATQRTLETRIRGKATPWASRLWQELSLQTSEAETVRMTETYGDAFSKQFLRSATVKRVVKDIFKFEELTGKHKVSADLHYDENDDIHLRVYQTTDIYLTELLPVLDNMGLVAINAFGTQINPKGAPLFFDTLLLENTGQLRSQLEKTGPQIIKALIAVFDGLVESDPLNRLILLSGLSWKEVDLLRSYVDYCRQLTFNATPSHFQQILLRRPELSAALVSYFHARFDPQQEENNAAEKKARQACKDGLRLIHTHDEDLVFSTLFNLIESTVRTNYYRKKKGHYLSFKLRSALVNELPEPKPLFEIYVHHKDVEGVHLRFGPVARGGLRWSNREDYRTEVLGLATTQQLKNVIIVPEGSKGGFYLRNPSPDTGVRREQADRYYKTFISGLLDVTDNLVHGKAMQPENVRRHDEDDPYLVVAADKGTAHLSDTANGISQAYGFWLDDAFASGGSNGYDHKKVGITAKGTWTLVRRHFAEHGKDPYSEPFTCVAIGDMGGDVFGNGMLETEQTQLLAAFNHLHIFLDPAPDAATSFKERTRLFKAERQGGWDNYDTSLISTGGGVYERSSKSIELSQEAQAMLGLEQQSAKPEEIISSILKMDVELLWNGGIGTYFKASTESHADADDRSNDAVRINADELRTKILGEGGNLGLTQLARIQAEQMGVKLNTDAIDNSAGVDMSDHEVNLKILLNQLLEAKSITLAKRNILLDELTDEVTQLVLTNNDTHGRQLSRDQIRSQQDPFLFDRAIGFVEQHMDQGRERLFLPSQEEIRERSSLGQGLTRPELATLSGWVKMYVYRKLMEADPRSLPGFEDFLLNYFPLRIQEQYPQAIKNHMLSTEIGATVATTMLIADVGASFFPVMIETTGRSVLEIASAYLKAQRLSRATEVRTHLEQLRTSIALQSLNRAWVTMDNGTKNVAAFWLSTSGQIPSEDELQKLAPAIERVYDLQPQQVLATNRERLDELLRTEIPAEAARLILKAEYLVTALFVADGAETTGLPLSDVTIQHLAVARASRLGEIIEHLAGRPASGQWENIALNILVNRYLDLLRQLVVKTPFNTSITTVDELEPQLTQGFLCDVRHQVDQLIGSEDLPEISTLLVAEERIRSAIKRLQDESPRHDA